MMNCNISKNLMDFPIAQMIKNLLAMQETQVQSLDQEDSLEKITNLPAMQEIQIRSLGREDPLEEEMATHSSILA